MRAPRDFVFALLLAAACGGSNGGDPGADGGNPSTTDGGPIDPPTEPDGGSTNACGDTRQSLWVYHGTTQPTYVPLTPGQVQAIGSWTGGGPGDIFCSGTLIAPTFVLTANHCGIRAGQTFCLGDRSSSATCIGVRAVHTSPQVTVGGRQVTLDLTVVELAQDATTRVPGVQPIPIVTESLDPLDDGAAQRCETAGYGLTETHETGRRFFAVEKVDAIGPADDGPEWFRVDGQGLRGVCNGDSGGPVMIIDAAGNARVAGALSYGDGSCVDKDRYTRVDIARAWVESFTGPTPTPDGGCGTVDAVGRCSGGRAMWCENDRLQTETCTAPESCGWDTGASGFRCISGTDPCGGYDNVGGCDGQTARWCEHGQARHLDCACLDQMCTVDTSAGGATCVPDPCMGIDYLGRCEGTVAVWCENNMLQRVDCAEQMETCGYIDDQVGYYCMGG